MTAGVTEKLAHRAPAIRSDELQRCRLRRRRRHDGRVFHRAVAIEALDDLGHRRALLPDRNVKAVNILATLIDDGVERDRGLAGLPVADDQLALAAADLQHRIDRLDAGLQRLLDGLPANNTRRLDLDT